MTRKWEKLNETSRCIGCDTVSLDFQYNLITYNYTWTEYNYDNNANSQGHWETTSTGKVVVKRRGGCYRIGISICSFKEEGSEDILSEVIPLEQRWVPDAFHECKKCENGIEVNDDTHDPGMCKKCLNGAVANDDSEDPGMCKKCLNGAVANDDSEDPGTCQKCQNGSVANDDSESCDDFDPCTAGDHCSGGGCVGTPIENPSPCSPECP